MKVVFDHAHIVDGTGKDWVGYIAVDGNIISKVGRGALDTAPAGLEVIDLAGQTVLPGFIDCHVHLRSDGAPNPRRQVLSDTDALCALRSARNARKTLECGVTTIRDCGSTNHVDFALRRAVSAGLCTSPRLVLSGEIICMTGGHGWNVGIEADGPDGVRVAARKQLRAGADNIKLIATGGILTEGSEIGSPQLTVEEMRAAVEEAKKAGKITAAHAHGATGIRNAIQAGVNSIEHGYFLDDEGIAMMLDHGTYLVATSAAVRNVVNHGTEAGILDYVVRKAGEAVEHHVESFGKAHRAGVKLAMGTDTGVPMTRHGNNLDELVHMVEMGLSPMEAIQVATLDSARLLQLDHIIGSIETGKHADLVIVDGDPLEDISILRDRDRIKWVILDGEAVVRRDRPRAE